MNRRDTVLALLALGATPLVGVAQQAGKIPRIGYLSAGSGEGSRVLAYFLQGLQELGYVEGKTIFVESRFAAGQPEKLREMAAELVRLKVDVIVGIDAAAIAAKMITSTIPIVVHSADPIGTGLVASLARPGGNVTGVSDLHSELIRKRLELIKEFVPKASRTAFLLNPTNPACSLQLKELQAAARAIRMTVESLEASGNDDIDRAFFAMKKDRVKAFLVCGDQVLINHQKQIYELAVRNRLPAIYTNSAWVERGGLVSYGANFADLYRRVAVYVDKILKGANPRDLPVEQPTKFELVINLKTAKALGIKIPQAILGRADRVIE
jgi:putative ABC transport system substrate-binding protein